MESRRRYLKNGLGAGEVGKMGYPGAFGCKYV